MEGKIKVAVWTGALWFAAGLMIAPDVPAQESGVAGETGDILLRKSAQSREYNGQEFEGENRVIAPGDSLWRILVKDKGVPEARFGQTLIIIRGLNPQLKSVEVLRVGDQIFIPLQPDGALASAAKPAKMDEPRPSAAGRGTTRDYRVKAGDTLYHVLREQLAMRDGRELAQFYALVKDLNPQRKNWDVLVEGDMIRLPARLKPGEVIIAGNSQTGLGPIRPAVGLAERKVDKPVQVAVPKTIALDYPQRLPTRANMALLAQVVEVLGGELQTAGEEVLVLKDGTLRLDRASYPVVYNPKLQQKALLDTDDKIPASLKSRLSDGNALPVIPVSGTSSLQDSVAQILTRLGYQPLAADRPVVIQQDGVTFEAKGHWIALGPEQNNKTQEIFVINLIESQGGVPDYLKTELARKGLHLKDILLSSASGAAENASGSAGKEAIPPIKYWPRDKREFVDAVLLALRVPSGGAETVKTQLRDGLSVEVPCDRIFEKDGKRTALFFNRIDPAFKTALQEREKIRVIEIDVAGLENKDIAARLLTEMGSPSKYQEHRFSLGGNGNQDRLQMKAWGFLLANRNMFITDRDIPPPLYRYFFEKGLEIVYF